METIQVEKTIKLVPKLRFNGFDEDWEEKKLGEIVQISSSARVHKEEWTEKGVPFFRSSDVVAAFNGKQNMKAYIPFDLYNSLSKKIGKVKIDDILITGGGSVGIPFLIKDNNPLYFKDADLLWIKNNEKISGYFLYSYFLTPLFKNHLKSVSHIGTIAHYTVIQAKNTPFNLPSLTEQQKIAFFLSAVDEKIQQLSRKKELLEQYKKGVMQQLFSGKLRFKDENGDDYADWEDKKLEEIFYSLKGKGISKNKVVQNGNFDCILYGELYTKYNEVIYDVVSKTNDVDGIKSKVGDLLIPSSTTTSGIDLANVTALNKDDVLLGGDITVLRSNYEINNVFYAYYLSNFKKEEIASYAQGSTIVHLYYSHIKDMGIHLLSVSEQTKIANFLSSIDAKIESTSQQINQIQSFKKGLLHQMFV